MRIQVDLKAQVFTVFDVHGIDPVTVVLQDLAPGKGRLIVECYGRAWSAYWGAMGETRTVAEFVSASDGDYVVCRLGAARRDREYLLKIVDAVKDALRQRKAAA